MLIAPPAVVMVTLPALLGVGPFVPLVTTAAPSDTPPVVRMVTLPPVVVMVPAAPVVNDAAPVAPVVAPAKFDTNRSPVPSETEPFSRTAPVAQRFRSPELVLPSWTPALRVRLERALKVRLLALLQRTLLLIVIVPVPGSADVVSTITAVVANWPVSVDALMFEGDVCRIGENAGGVDHRRVFGLRLVDGDVGRVEQQRPGHALRRAGIDLAVVHQRLLARDLDEAAVAAALAAAGADAALVTGQAVGPDRDGAAVTLVDRVGAQDRPRGHDGRFGVADVGVRTVEVAADPDRAAAGASRRVDDAAVVEEDALPFDRDAAAALAGGQAGGVDPAGRRRRCPRRRRR